MSSGGDVSEHQNKLLLIPLVIYKHLCVLIRLNAESNPHWKRVRRTAGDANQALTLAIQGADSPYQKARHPILPKNPPQDYLKKRGQMPSPAPHNTCGLVGQTPTHPLGPCWGCQAGPLFHV